MAAVTYSKCPVCDQTHSLFLGPDDSFVPGTMYEYLCPSRRRIARLLADESIVSRQVRNRLRGTLLVTKTQGNLAAPLSQV